MLVSFDDEPFTLYDAVIASVISEQWAPFVVRVGAEVEADASVPSSVVREALVGFRRVHRLDRAVDLRAWLDERGVSDEALARHCRALADPSFVPNADRRDGPAPSVHGDAWLEHAYLGGELETWANDVTRWAAAAHLRASSARSRVPQSSASAPPEVVAAAQSSPAGDALSPSDVTERTDRIWRLWIAHEELRRTVGSDVARIDEVVRRHTLEWATVEYDVLTFGTAGAAREAVVCIDEDGEPAQTLAARVAATIERCRGRREHCPDWAKPELDALSVGRCSYPIAIDDGHRVIHLRERLAPSHDDPELRGRAVDLILGDQLSRALAGRVDWHGVV